MGHGYGYLPSCTDEETETKIGDGICTKEVQSGICTQAVSGFPKYPLCWVQGCQEDGGAPGGASFGTKTAEGQAPVALLGLSPLHTLLTGPHSKL